ncbi:MAG: alpha-galactosidase [Dysgonamonadaceae bacterium]|jgi:alpha-galactosidase|nr:alpha-galactosidase [Dysgonamonadaceae bacterium]
MKKILLLGLLFVILAVKSEVIKVETADLAMVFTVNQEKKVVYQYFGEKQNDYSGFEKRIFPRRPDTRTDFSPELYPAYGHRSYQEPALQATHYDGVLTTQLLYAGHEIRSIDSNTTETVIRLKDAVYPFFVDVVFSAYQKENVISQRTVISHNEQGTVALGIISSAYLPLHNQVYYLTHFHGTWAAEMQLKEEQLQPGIKKIESKKGVRTTQSENPSFLIAFDHPAMEEEGEVYGGSLAWSGNYCLAFELDETGMLNILSGVNPFISTYKLKGNERFETPEMIWTYSRSGKGAVSRNFHDWSRKYALRAGNSLRPIVLNSWEGAYFTFDEKVITGMIDDAAKFGIELFVLDDGWFGNRYPRNNDNAGLGDWQVNIWKLPRGIDYLAFYAHQRGMKFGIWIEPEMVNPESDLARLHPEWIVKSGTREILTLRNQWLLDLTNPVVQDFVYQTFVDVMALSKYIDYIKWDANRHVENVGSDFLSGDCQSHFWIDYTKGLYSVYERVRARFPDVMIQLCSSGGGRLDFGALRYHNEFWASDNTNPYNRVFIQYGTNHFFPAMATGAHVSTSPNHQTGVTSPIKFRFDVAMSGRLGMELQPGDIAGEDRIFARQAVENYKKIRSVVQLGDLYRIHSPYSEEAWATLAYVSKDKKESVLFAYSLKPHERTKYLEIKLKGLDASKKYKLVELNAFNGHSSFDGNENVFTGEFLMKTGIYLNINRQYDSAVIWIKEDEVPVHDSYATERL